jgi:hypothetical protein
MLPLASKGYTLISPAMSSRPNGKDWMATFMANCGNDCNVSCRQQKNPSRIPDSIQVAGIATHYYGTDIEEFKTVRCLYLSLCGRKFTLCSTSPTGTQPTTFRSISRNTPTRLITLPSSCFCANEAILGLQRRPTSRHGPDLGVHGCCHRVHECQQLGESSLLVRYVCIVLADPLIQSFRRPQERWKAWITSTH